MARTVNWDTVPDTTLLPQDIYPLEIEALEEQVSKAGNLMYTATLRVVDGNFAGAPLFERFAIGVADDPNAEDPQTWIKSVGARRLKRLFRAAQVPLSDDVDQMVSVAKGQRFSATVTQETDDGTADPRYKGQVRNRIAAMYALGERDTSPAPAPPRPAAAPRAAAAPKAAAPRSVSKVATVKCGFCGEQVPRTDYMAHVETAHPDQE